MDHYKIKFPPEPEKCLQCGMMVQPIWFHTGKMWKMPLTKQRVCFSCDHWTPGRRRSSSGFYIKPS